RAHPYLRPVRPHPSRTTCLAWSIPASTSTPIRPLLVVVGAVVADPLDEPGVGRVDVQYACATAACVPEAVTRAGRRGDERARAEPSGVVACGELDLAFEDVEGIDVIGVRVRVDGERLVEGDLEHRHAGQVDADGERPVVAGENLAITGSADGGFHARIV